MSAVLILALLMALLGFLFSFTGFFVFLLGVCLFLVLAIIPRLTGEFKRFANLHLWLATAILQRAAIVVSEHGDLLLKRMSFDDLGVEKIAFGDEKKEFGDPDDALHYWLGIPFALADEAHGVLFDPRHAALGNKKQAAKERGEYTIFATQEEWDQYGVHEWVRGVFEFPKGKHELVDLSGVRHLVDGGERAEYPKRVEKIYELSREPFKSGTSATQWIMIIVALLAPFGLMWFTASQGGGGGPDRTIGYDSLLLLIGGTTGLHSRLKDVDWRRAGASVAVLLPLPAVFLLVFVFVSPLMAILSFVTLGIGFWFIPLLTILLRPSARLSTALARMLLKLGFLGYEKPVFEWTPEKYRLREYSDLDDTGNVIWYNLAGTIAGFTFKPGPESWGAEVVEHGDLEAKSELVPDGGELPDSNIPANYRRAPQITRASRFAAFVPKRLKRSAYYLNTGIATGRFTDSAVGEKSLNRLLWAKEVHGGEGGISDTSMLYAMVGCGTLSFVLGVFVFFL